MCTRYSARFALEKGNRFVRIFFSFFSPRVCFSIRLVQIQSKCAARFMLTLVIICKLESDVLPLFMLDARFHSARPEA